MPKKSTGFTPTGRGKNNPTEKMSVPNKAPSIKTPKLPQAISGGSNAVASMPKLTRPAKLAPRTPRI